MGERVPAEVESIFPNEDRPDARLSPAEVEALAWVPSPWYAALSRVVARRWEERGGPPVAAGEVLAREAAVLIGYAFLERLLRWERLVARAGAESLSCPAAPAPRPGPDTVTLRGLCAGSREFNQWLIAELAPIFGVPVSEQESAAESPAVKPPAVLNHNFTPVGLGRRVLRRLARDGGRLFGRAPCLGMAYASDYLLDGWVIGPGRLSPLSVELPPAPPVNESLRAAVLAPAFEQTGAEMTRAAESIGIPRERAIAALPAWSSIALRLWPAPLFEAAPVRVASARTALERYGRAPLFFSDSGDARTTTVIAAARAAGNPVVDCQHAVHYGFVPATTYTELEYENIDRFVSWGWTSMPRPPRGRAVRVDRLPSPWMSERRREWRSQFRPALGGRGCLLMTDKFQRFPATAGTNRLSRNDFIPDFAKDLERVVTALVSAGLAVRHKPFDAASRDALSRVIERLRVAHPEHYALHESLDKGLTPELAATASVLIWDEPGTGLFECLAGGLPTILYWPRLYTREEPGARDSFLRLEEAGLACRDASALARLAASAAAGPMAWVADPSRRAAAERFVDEWAKADDDWASAWRAYVRAA